eukprot:2644777-Prymnesium_polylepis.1
MRPSDVLIRLPPATPRTPDAGGGRLAAAAAAVVVVVVVVVVVCSAAGHGGRGEWRCAAWALSFRRRAASACTRAARTHARSISTHSGGGAARAQRGAHRIEIAGGCGVRLGYAKERLEEGG